MACMSHPVARRSACRLPAGEAGRGRRNTECLAVRFPGGAKGSQNKKKPKTAARTAAPAARLRLSCARSRGMARQSCCLLTASLVTSISHDFPLFPTKSRPPLPPSKGPHRVRPSRSASRRTPLAAALVASVLVPLRRTQNELMLRKGNVLYCTNSETFCIALTKRFNCLSADVVTTYNRPDWR